MPCQAKAAAPAWGLHGDTGSDLQATAAPLGYRAGLGSVGCERRSACRGAPRQGLVGTVLHGGQPKVFRTFPYIQEIRAIRGTFPGVTAFTHSGLG